jgi:hypothetical protein
MKGIRMNVQPVPSSQPIDLRVKIDMCTFTRRLDHTVTSNITDEVTLAALHQPLMRLRQACTAMDKLGVQCRLAVPDWSKPMEIDFSLRTLFDSASDLFESAKNGAALEEIEMRKHAVYCHRAIKAIRDVLKLGPSRQRTEGGAASKESTCTQ